VELRPGRAGLHGEGGACLLPLIRRTMARICLGTLGHKQLATIASPETSPRCCDNAAATLPLSSSSPRSRLRKPRRIQDRSGPLSIDVRPDFAAPGISERLKFIFAVLGAVLWKVSILDYICE
jgi:hypothetical protein